MNGIGRAWGAITIVNALSNGIGCAAAVSLPVEVEVDLTASAGAAPDVSIPTGSDTLLVRSVLDECLGLFAPGRRSDVRVAVRSSIPIARGLKSSSAVGVALIRAVASASHHSIEPSDAARLSAGLSRAHGLSATGAFDDAMAAAVGGLVVTRNGPDELLRAEPVDPDWRAAIWVPSASHDPSPAWFDAFRARAADGRLAAERAQAGDYLEAMRQNTELVEHVVGYEYASLRAELSQRGALASGVSGMGPALAAISPADRLGRVAGGFPKGTGEVLTVDFVSPARADRSAGGP